MKRPPSSGPAQRHAVDRARTILYLIVAIVALIGLAETTYLTAMHLAGATVVCIGSSNCSEVLGSVYASIRGVPLAALGALGYYAAFSFALLAAFRYRRAPALLLATVGAMFLTTLWLLYLQRFVLRIFCDYCLFSAALVFLLAGLVIAVPPRRSA